MQFLSQVIPGPYYVPGGFNITGGGPFLQTENAVVIGVGGFNTSLAGNTTIEAAEYVQVLPSYEAVGFTNGQAWLKIRQDVARVASFHTNGFSAIPKFERFEIGVAVPQIIQAKIDAYLLAGVNGASRINPYDPDQIRVECLYTLQGPSQLQYTRHAFYRSSDNIVPDYQNNDWSVGSGTPSFPFRIRFAPPAPGNWKGRVKIYVNNSSTPNYLSYDFDFTVVASGNKGHLSVSTNPKTQKFKYDDGTIFYAIGRNVPFAVNYAGPSSGCLPPANSIPWQEWKSRPQAHKEQRNAIIDVAVNGGNFLRIRLDRVSVPIEETPFCEILSNSGPSVNHLTNFSTNEKFMWEMDSTLAVCESNNIKIMLTLLDNWDFVYLKSLNDSNGIRNPGGWQNNPYSVSGLATRNDFFTDPNAVKTFKKRLYYIEARWGYSTSLGAWEMFNETEGMGGNAPGNDWDAVTSYLFNYYWLPKVKDSLQINIYPVHPVTNGVMRHYGETNAVNWTPLAYNNGGPGSGYCLDFYTDHLYQSEINPDCTNDSNTKYNSIIKASQDFAAPFSDYWNVLPPFGPHKKPLMFGEFGLLLQDTITEVELGPIILRRSALTFHNQNWGSLFTNSMGIGLQWWNWNIYNINDGGPPSVNPNDPKANPFHVQYNALSKFATRINFNTLLLPDRNLSNISWRSFGPLYPTNENEDDATPVTTYWMRSVGKDTIYGWTKNTSANFMSDIYNSNFPIGFPLCYNGTPNIPTANVSATSNLTKVQGLLPNTTYDVKVYDTWAPSGPQYGSAFNVTTNGSGKLVFGLDMTTLAPQSTPADYYPDYAFIAIKRQPITRSAVDDSSGTQGANNHLDTTNNNSLFINFPDANTGNTNTVNSTSSFAETKITADSGSENLVNLKDYIYPVPASSQIYLMLSKQWQNPEIFIIDELSRETKKIWNSDRSIDVKELSNGFYFLRVKDAKHEKMFKIVIER